MTSGAPVTPAPTPSPTEQASAAAAADDAVGVNGDPLIMGLSNQVFFFDGRSGSWYSAVSTPSFQWNMGLETYKGCPKHADNFVAGVGFTFFDKKGKADKRVKVKVLNPHGGVNVGCGGGSANCLGFGSLEIEIDGVAHVTGGDYEFMDGGGRIVAFNTFYECSRKWYDFDTNNLSSSSRRLENDKPDVFDVLGSLKPTMVDPEVCQKWMTDRHDQGNLFDQPGRWSTVIIETPDITFHLEYKQQNEVCDAHTIDVWISSVSLNFLAEHWEGVIGETKLDSQTAGSAGTRSMKKEISRAEALKYPRDDAYEVRSPFSTKCKGCAKRR
jgi:hypothetical protein